MLREEREDAIDIIQSILDKYEEDECLATEITIGDEDIKAFKMAIKALEQEPKPVLDKIRAEIDKARFIDKDTRIVKNALASGLEVALQIIDKYKAETENKE